ncbi:pseudouridine synthase [Tautonia rosea]|uniref:pseudouridine synthase n=1 Tax=Tautonia rosea TaxID=2728037 RepID=UPI0019D13A71|nr:pseudouridine synthase [Tautonia rosea]
MLAAAGLGSRRAVEELILQGRVLVDGQVVRDLATRVDPTQATITVDGERIRQEKIVYLAVYKPKGFVTTNSDPAGRPRVIDIVPDLPQRVYPIGRLDEDSTGLILLTNDGELANRLAHPKFGVEKVYRVLVAGKPGPEVIDRLVEGVWLAEGKARARSARFVNEKSNHGEATMIELTLAEGKNREVRRMLAKLGHKVMRLTRVSVGPVTLKGLSAGQWRYLEPEEVAMLRRVASGESVRPRDSRRREAPRRKSEGGPASAGPRSGMGHLVGSAGGGPKGKRPTGPPPQGGRDRDQGSRRPGGVPRRGAVGSFAPPPSGSKGRRSAHLDDGPDEILIPPISSGDLGGPPPAGRPPRPAGPRSRPPAGRPSASGGPSRNRGTSGPGAKRRSSGGPGGPQVGGGNGPSGGRRPALKPPGQMAKRRPKPLPKSRRSKSSENE